MLGESEDLSFGERPWSGLVQQLATAQRLRTGHAACPIQVHNVNLFEPEVCHEGIGCAEQIRITAQDDGEIKVSWCDGPVRIGNAAKGDQQIDAGLFAQPCQAAVARLAT